MDGSVTTTKFGTVMCEICNKNESKGVCSSQLGGISYAYCQECLDRRAEAKEMIEVTLEINGGWENTADWVKDLTYFEDGEYKKASCLKG